jgi:hypothetical protein
MKKVFYLIALIAICGFWSCNKNEVSVQPVEITEASEHVLSFDTYDDYSAERTKVQAMSLEERIRYENSKGFRSFGTQCEQIYFSADLDNMTDDQIREFVNANDEYLELVEEDGEVYLEAKLAKSSDFYLINKDKMFKCESMVTKTIDNNTSVAVFCDENFDELKELNKDNLYRVEGNEDFVINTAERIGVLKSTTCPQNVTDRATDGRDRVKIDISYTHGTKVIGGVANNIDEARFELRPYKRTLGIWYWCSRTVSYSVKAMVDYYNVNAGQRMVGIFNKGASGISTSYVNEPMHITMFPATIPNIPRGFFIAYNCRGTSASVSENAVLQCNIGDINF